MAEEMAWPRLLLGCCQAELLTTIGLGRAVALDQGLRAAGGWAHHRQRPAPAHEVFRVARLAWVLDVRQASAGSMPAVGDDAPAGP